MRLSAIVKLIGSIWLAGAVQSTAHAELPVEPLTVEQLPAERNPHRIWLNDVAYFAMSDGRAYLLDGDSGGFMGMLSTGYAHGGIVTSKDGTVYSPETYFSRGTRGTRTDVITIYHPTTLEVSGEIPIPPKRAAITPKVNAAVLTDDEQFLLIYNFTPAQSVSVIDTKRREFVREIETEGCALMYPTGPRSFFSLCPDGKALAVSLNDAGAVANTVHSEPIVDVQADPITERAVRVGDTWYFTSFAGQVYPLKGNAQGVRVGEKWWLTTTEERKQWRPGGLQDLAVHRASKRLYVLMHQGGPHTHKDPGTEIWVFDLMSKRRVQKIALENPATAIQVSQDPKPLLFSAFFGSPEVGVYDALSGKLQRTIQAVGLTPTTLINP